jgi:hypothetical protein
LVVDAAPLVGERELGVVFVRGFWEGEAADLRPDGGQAGDRQVEAQAVVLIGPVGGERLSPVRPAPALRTHTVRERRHTEQVTVDAGGGVDRRLSSGLACSGRNDDLVPWSNNHYLDDLLPNSEIHALDAGHFAWEQAAEEYGGLVADWVSDGYRRVAAG